MLQQEFSRSAELPEDRHWYLPKRAGTEGVCERGIFADFMYTDPVQQPITFDRSNYSGKRVGIMQPYFFPYLGYFGLIAHTDRWIVLHPVQYIRKGWVNRNRVIKAGGGWKYVGIPLRALARDPDQGYDCVRGDDHFDTERILDLTPPEHTCAALRTVIELLTACYDPPPSRLSPFSPIRWAGACAYLRIPSHVEMYSQMELEHEPAEGPGDWSLNICKALGVHTYLNPQEAKISSFLKSLNVPGFS